MRSDAATVSEYLRDAPAEPRRVLRLLRRMIRAAAPGAAEAMEYGHPVYRMGEPLFAIARQKHHVSLYVADPGVIRRHRDRLPRGVSVGKSCIRFPTPDHADARVIERLVADAVARRVRASGR